MPSEHKSRRALQKKVYFYGYWLDTEVEEMHRAWNTVNKSLMWISPCSCFLLEAGIKKSANAHTRLPTFFSQDDPASAPALISEEDVELHQSSVEQMLKETSNCCKLFPGRITVKIAVFTPSCHRSQFNLFRRRADSFRILKWLEALQ